MRKLVIGILALSLLVVASTPVEAQKSLNDLWMQSWQNCGGQPCLNITRATSSGQWSGGGTLNDLMFLAFSTCSGVPCLSVNDAGGAVAHNFLSVTHTDTTPASVVRGDIVTGQGATPTWSRLAKGTQYQVLNIGANEPLWDAVHLDQAAAITGVLPLANGGTAAALTASTGGIFYSTASAGAILSGTATASKMLLSGASAAPTWSTSTIPTSAGATAGKVLLSDGTNYVLSTPTFPNASATSGKTIRSDGTNWIASTATLSDSPSTAGKVLVSDGTNWITSTPTFPNASATALKHIRSDGTNWIASTATISDTPSTAGKVLVSDGTNWITSTPTFPNASATTGKYIKSDGTNWIASTGSASGTGTCTNQAVTALSSDAAPTCTTLTSAYTSGTFNATTANPSASVGLAAVNGVSASAMAADSAPALSQSIAPTWTGLHKFANAVTVIGTGDLSGTLTGVNLRGPNADGSTNNVAGVVTTITSSLGSGTGAAGILTFSSAQTLGTSGATIHSAVSHLRIGNARTAAPTSVGVQAHFFSLTDTDETTAGSGTATQRQAIAFLAPAITARNTSVTITDAATVWINGAPTASASINTPTLSNTWGLWNAGASRLDGKVLLGSTAFASLGTPANGTITFCNDCDAPTLVDSTCTSSGAKTGALAVRQNSTWKCIS